jgi:hypothetical protein
LLLGRCLRIGARCGDGTVAGLDNRIQRLLLMGSVAFHGLHQIGNEIVALLELHVDVGESLVGPAAQGDHGVVGRDQIDRDRGDDRQQDPA